jgi:hypothetical protein
VARPTARTAIREEAEDRADVEIRRSMRRSSRLGRGTDSPITPEWTPPATRTLSRFRVPLSDAPPLGSHITVVSSRLWSYRTILQSYCSAVEMHCSVPQPGSLTSRNTGRTSSDHFSGQSLLVLPPSTSILAQSQCPPAPPRLRPSRHPRSLVLGHPDRPRLCVATPPA